MTAHGNWTLGSVDRLAGKTAIVTGATSGLGYETALGLARMGANTILAGRNTDKGNKAIAAIRMAVPGAAADFRLLDLDSLDDVARFAAAWTGPLDILVNNAGIMALPARQTTRDGFERQIGVNYLAHFALTARLLGALNGAEGGGRVISVASLAHRRARLDLDDLQSERSYQPMRAYGQSKLAMLVFALELQRRAASHGWRLRSIAAHPGWARTSIIGNGPGQGNPDLKARLMETAFGLLAQSAAAGALPMLYAASSDDAQGGGYYGPSSLGETRGAPRPSRIFPQAADPETGARLWSLSEQLTGLRFG